MIKLELSEAQEEKVALAWLDKMKSDPHGYEKVLGYFFSGLHTSPWDWLDAIKYVVKKCSSNYHINKNHIIEDLY